MPLYQISTIKYELRIETFKEVAQDPHEYLRLSLYCLLPFLLSVIILEKCVLVKLMYSID